ncbi:alpha-N-acetyl-neuraminyl-2,3-beta-galactosyl-1,3-N-acetyl-galactosaminide alpha-2,6-sialyltransferase isoform X1 [Tachysurus fulvidraco]|uniref:alpha-N-acetyl-neuraminyl-2,3-beta-galactosyl-1, 3-N-acetyl-galactosaminide alpha-2,6-sialyltransferase isoform X1 n=1 Tax=Tachysurus fulvidraco TaxID=1234273 RepID=UPI000F4F0A00|nr:alpha-N-acetyl-neuraminyl-2,3-beta-galactosyl-1,3-N-acetyl-galactosaminide alpha-2,6-sialyltransferase isoform X1 [Tachysurus fulvidraco]XP_027035435.1 alpha-N-acetyl-neuraminyl-2,3-beta-galactosyl-1,3-N-acetyl-galactosaminide alpha-2,6-sialyltransferase isoform X1 [Tachysurus fulvidraco]
MMSQRFCWLLLLLITVSLLLWYNHVTKTIEVVLGLRGYVRILPLRLRSQQYLALHCASCAVVSSSGQVLGSRCGREIDGHECVIRMNAAPTQRFESDVGNKTTVRVVSHSSVRRLLQREAYFFNQESNTRYVVWGPERNMRHDGKGRVFNMLVKLAWRYPSVHIYTVSREKMMHCDRVFQDETGKNRMKSGAFLSTGFFTMIFAQDMCDSINVYGMIDGSYCSLTNSSSVPYHYYESNRLDECGMYRVHERVRRGGHRFITEKQIYRRWASQGKLKFQYPPW